MRFPSTSEIIGTAEINNLPRYGAGSDIRIQNLFNELKKYAICVSLKLINNQQDTHINNLCENQRNSIEKFY